MSTGTSTKGSPSQTPTKEGSLDAPQQAWLSRLIGGKELYDGSTGLVPRDEDGENLDLKAIEDEVAQYADGELPEGIYALEIAKKRQILEQFGIPSVTDATSKFDESSKKREKALQEMRELIELQKEEIRNATDLEVTVKKRAEVFGKEILYSSKKVSTKGKNTEDEYDSEHYKNRVVEGPTPQQKKALDAVITQLELLTEKLKNNEDFPFTPQELMNEMWTPLVREELVSEDQCPAEFSRVLQLFRGASELYNKRMEAQARKEEDRFENARDYIGDVSEVLGIGAAGADLVLSLVGGQDNVQKLLKIVTKCTQAGMKTATALMENKTNYKDAASSVGDIIGTVIESAVGGEQGKTIGKVAKGAFAGVANLSLFAKKLSERDYDSGLDLLAEAVGAAVGCLSDALDNKGLEEASKHVESGLKTTFKGGKLIYLLSQEPVDMVQVKLQIKGMTQEVLKEALRTSVDQSDYQKKEKAAEDNLEKIKGELGEESQQYIKAKKEFDSLKQTHSDNLSGFGTMFDNLFDKGGELLPALQAKVDESAVKRGAAADDQERMEENAAFNKKLGAAFGMSVGAEEGDTAMIEEMYSIESLISQIERDRATLEMFNLIFDSAGAVLTTFIPQLGGTLKAKAFALNVVAAAERSMDLLTFVNLVDDARKARSPQTATLLAEVDELKRHLTNDTLEAAIAFGQAVSLSIAAAGDLAAGAMGTGAAAGLAGRAVSSGLDAFKKSKDLLKKKFEDKKTVQAWEMYKKALGNPKDRRHLLKTFRSNPTLAKYGIAYGAIEMDDPIARETLRQVGLNDVVLAQENSSADKVVMFLEAKFSDDIKVEGVISRFAPDLGDPLSLTVWVKNKEAAAHVENPDDGRWKTEKTNAIDSAMSAVEDLADETTKNDITAIYRVSQWNEREPIWQQYIAAQRTLQEVLRQFKPLTVSGLPFKRFIDYVNELIVHVEKQIEEAEQKVNMQRTLLNSQKQALENSKKVATACIESARNAIPAFGAPDGRKPMDVLEKVLNSGPAFDLLNNVTATARETPRLQPHIEQLRHAVDFSIRKTERAVVAEKSKSAIMTADVIRSLINDTAIFQSAVQVELNAITTDLSDYATLKP